MRMSSKMTIALSALIALGLLVAIAGLFGARSIVDTGRPSAAVSLAPVQAVVDSPLPSPAHPTEEIVVITPPPDGGVIVLEPGKVYVFPSPTPFPTRTPWPTPTLRPGPTATAMPMPEPAMNAAGTIFYASRTKFNTEPGSYLTEGDILRTQVDAAGITSPAFQEVGLGWMRSGTSWDRTLVAFVNRTMGGDRVTILDTTTDEITMVELSLELSGYFAGWHPDNKQLLYLVDNHANGGLWLINTVTGERTIVVQQDPLYIYDAAISPDGQRIVYSQQKDWQTPGEVWSVFADGSEPKRLIVDETVTGLSWSPDDKKLAYLGSEGLTILRLDTGTSQVVAKNARANGLFRPVWSPSGRFLAYVAYEPDTVPLSFQQQGQKSPTQDWDKEAFVGSNVHILDMETGEERPLVQNYPSDGISGFVDPVWSPDGTMLAMAGIQAGKTGVWVVDSDGAKLQRLAGPSTLARFPAWTTAQ